jgi:Immunity protein 26
LYLTSSKYFQSAAVPGRRNAISQPAQSPARCMQAYMTSYELTNNQRKYFGLSLVGDEWDKVRLTDSVAVYYQGDKIVKVLHYSLGYFEYDTDIETKYRQFLLPKTTKGKEQKLTVSKILKLKGSGVQFSGSFQGGGIHVYDNRRNLFFIKGFSDDGEIKNYNDIEKWVTDYISKTPSNYFDWLNGELSQKRLRVKIKEGDIVAFKIAHGQYGFARILFDVFAQRKKGDFVSPNLYWFHPKSLIVAPYAYYADTLQIDIDKLVNQRTLPTLCIFDLDVYRGEMPIVGHKPLSLKDKLIPFPNKSETSITIPYTKTDIETFISTNGTGKS